MKACAVKSIYWNHMATVRASDYIPSLFAATVTVCPGPGLAHKKMPQAHGPQCHSMRSMQGSFNKAMLITMLITSQHFRLTWHAAAPHASQHHAKRQFLPCFPCWLCPLASAAASHTGTLSQRALPRPTSAMMYTQVLPTRAPCLRAAAAALCPAAGSASHAP